MACVVDSIRAPLAETVGNLKLKQKKVQALLSKVPQTYLLAAGLFAAFLPFDDTQMIFLVVGALFYLLVHRMQSRVNKNMNIQGKRMAFNNKAKGMNNGAVGGASSKHTFNKQSLFNLNQLVDSRTPNSKQEGSCKTITWQAIQPPSFSVTGFEAEVSELMPQIMPTARCEKAVQDITKLVNQTLRGFYPDIEVLGFCTGDLNRGKAFGVAVPDVDIIININPALLARTINSRNTDPPDNDLMKIYKATLRSCTEKLVSKGGFKFRRSAFRKLDPKVTLLTPNVVGELDHAVPMDFSINTTVPMYYAALLADAEVDPRAKELIMFVKRWSKDRGICHAAKGYLSPYLWCVMAVFFLQQPTNSDDAVLPLLEDLPMASRLVGSTRAVKLPVTEDKKIAKTPTEKQVGTLFKEFVHFFHAIFDWKVDVVSITGAETNINAQGSNDALRIADPFEGGGDLAAYLDVVHVVRIKAEFARAHELCCKEASLVELLELWTPPESKEAVEADNKW